MIKGFGRYVRACRMEQQVTRAVLAQRAGLAQQALADLEMGFRMPGMEELRALASALGRPENELLARSGLVGRPGAQRSLSDLV